MLPFLEKITPKGRENEYTFEGLETVIVNAPKKE